MTAARFVTPDGSTTIEIDDTLLDPHSAALDDTPDAAPVRLVYAAAHIVMQDSYRTVAHAPESPGAPEDIAAHIDWEATTRFRTHLATHGFGIAEAMDTAQRFEIGWPAASRLIELTGGLQLSAGFVAGAGTDHLDSIDGPADLIDGVLHQIDFIHDAGGMPIVLPLPWLSINECDAAMYVDVYREIIAASPCELFVHWLGEMFLPSLRGYFPGDSFERIMDIDPSIARGAKLSLLDDELERRLRRRLLERDQILLTGDDLHFSALIAGDDPAIARTTTIAGRQVPLGNFSHGLLGVFDGTAAPAGLAVRHLARRDLDRYRTIMTPCEALGQVIFEPPTLHYKAGLAFLAWLNGHQANPMLPNHLEAVRSRHHLLRVAEAAAAAGAIMDAGRAVDRLTAWASESS